MSYRLGIDVGSSCIAAAICRDEPSQPVQLEVVPLGARSAVVRSVVYLAPDGEVVVGEAAERRAAADPERMAGELTDPAADLLAQVIRWVVDRVAQREGGPAHGVTLAHPAGWDPSTIQALADALGQAQLPDLRFCPGPQAAAASYSARERIQVGATLAVYDLGGGSFETAVLRKTAGGTFAILGDPERTGGVGGAVFDDAVFGHVRAAVPALSELEPEDSATRRVQRSLALCRRECTAAKEALSVETEVTIPVLLPQLQSQVLLTRTEFERLIRPDLEQTVEALHRTLRSAALNSSDLDAVLLVGGSSRVPLVERLLSAEFGAPVVLADDPQAAVALGAALCGLPADVALPAGADNEVPAPVGAMFSAAPDPVDTELPPWLAAAPPDTDPPPDDRERPSSSPRLSRYAVAGLLGLVIVGGAVSVPFILPAQHGPTPAPAATPPPGPPALDTAIPQNPAAPQTLTPQTLTPPSPPPVAPAADVPGPDAGAVPPAPSATPGGTARSRAVAPHAVPRATKPAPAPAPPPPPPQVPDWVRSARS